MWLAQNVNTQINTEFHFPRTFGSTCVRIRCTIWCGILPHLLDGTRAIVHGPPLPSSCQAQRRCWDHGASLSGGEEPRLHGQFCRLGNPSVAGGTPCVTRAAPLVAQISTIPSCWALPSFSGLEGLGGEGKEPSSHCRSLWHQPSPAWVASPTAGGCGSRK